MCHETSDVSEDGLTLAEAFNETQGGSQKMGIFRSRRMENVLPEYWRFQQLGRVEDMTERGFVHVFQSSGPRIVQMAIRIRCHRTHERLLDVVRKFVPEAFNQFLMMIFQIQTGGLNPNLRSLGDDFVVPVFEEGIHLQEMNTGESVKDDVKRSTMIVHHMMFGR